MKVSEARKKFPVIRGRDFGPQLRVRDIVERLAKALDAKASEESTTDVACDIIDRDLLFGAWGDRWEEKDYDLLRDIRGIIIAAYRAGRRGS